MLKSFTCLSNSWSNENITPFALLASSRVILLDSVLQMGELTLLRGGKGGLIKPPFVEGGIGPMRGEESVDTMLSGGEC